MIALVALGNRGWGSGISHGHILGLFLMTSGLWIGSHEPIYSLLPTALGVWLFREWGDAGWLDMLDAGGSWLKGFLRSAAILPLIMWKFYLHRHIVIIACGLSLVVMIPAIYWFGGKISRWLNKRTCVAQNKIIFDAAAIAELLTGIII